MITMRRPARILLIEDDDLDAALVARELGPAFEISRADTPAGLADALADPDGWDAILTDHSLPTLDTFRVLQAVRENDVRTPVIIVSGQMGEQNLARAMVEGAADYVAKDRLQRLKPAVERAIRARKDAIERERLERERTIFFDMSIDLFAITDLRGRFRLMNRAWERMLGRTAEELREQGVRGLVEPADREITRRAMDRLAQGETLLGFENHVRAADGTARSLVWNATPIPDADTILVVARDVTEEKRQQEAAKRQEHLASLGVLIAGVAHEINNPLTYIAGNVEFTRLLLRAETDARDLPPHTRETLAKVDEALESVERGAARIGSIANQLRAVARPMHAERTPTDVHTLIERALATVPDPHGPPVRIKRDVRAEAPVLANEGEIQQVLAWLLKNAREAAANANEPTVRITTEEDAEGHVHISISDNGPGISAEDAAKIFTPFFTTKAQGTGLALAVAHSIAHEHGGALAFTSTPGGGATFTLTLPRASATRTADTATATAR